MLPVAAAVRLENRLVDGALADPLAGEDAALHLFEDLFHHRFHRGRDDARAAREIAVFGRLTDGIAHVRQAAFVDEIHDQLQFVHALEEGQFGLVAGLDQRLETRLDQRRDAAAQDHLLAEQVRLGLFADGRFQDAAARPADALGVRQRRLFCLARCVLLDRQQTRDAGALFVLGPDEMPRTFGRDHDHVHVLRRLDLSEVKRKAVADSQRLAGGKMRLEPLIEDCGVVLIGHEQHDEIGLLGDGGGVRFRCEALLESQLPVRGTFARIDNNLEAGIAQVQRLGMPLTAKADHADRLALQETQVRVVVVVHLRRHDVAPCSNGTTRESSAA